MGFRMLFYATVAMPFAAGLASAELRLSELEMDTITAGLGEQLALIDCPACTVTTSASTSLNGVTTATGSSGVTTTTGSTRTAGGGLVIVNAGGGGSAPGVLIGSVPVPPGVAAALNQALVVTTSLP
jgi:hypothetical protein